MNHGITRRELVGAMAVASALAQKPAAGDYDMGGLKYKMPEKPEQIAMLVYPGMTALDLIGPNQVFGYTMGTRVHLVAKEQGAVKTDTGLSILPTKTFSDCPNPVDILFVPGGAIGTINLMKDEETLKFLADRGQTATLVTSVCTGSLILGRAGLLRGYKATSHWAVRDVLSELGATPVNARVVEDRNRITAAGITSGIDFALRIAAKLRGDEYARALELQIEYDPQPPFQSGSPEKAGERIHGILAAMLAPLHDQALQLARASAKAM